MGYAEFTFTIVTGDQLGKNKNPLWNSLIVTRASEEGFRIRRINYDIKAL